MAKRKPKRLVLHVLPYKSRNWVVKQEKRNLWLANDMGHGLYLSATPFICGYKDTAIKRGARYCRAHQPSQLIIHKRDGVIQSERTYGDDPYPPKG